ncbi:oil body-associated protein 2A-like [Rutidosis leptorrhynchoides]|uniref:oil body-associated protein 2A-like n=1 Tax=Rutidosis leptorrhynchoides TaxID=125765 RepID=UPI003A99FB50
MASSDKAPDSMPVGDGSVPPGKPMTVGHQVIDKSAQMLQTLKPIKQMSIHACTFSVYGHDMSRQIECHHYITRMNQDFLQCAVYDSDEPSAHLIGVEYIVSDRIFDTLPHDEQKLWHSHDHEVTSGLWVNPGVLERIQRTELENIARTYGKFWCTWQVDRGDRLPLGAPALMMSPQVVNMGVIKPELVLFRDNKYKISSEELKKTRANIPESKPGNARVADYWMHTGKGFAIDIEEAEMKRIGAPQFP